MLIAPLCLLLLLLAACGPAQRPDVIFLPTATDVLDRMLALGRVEPGDRVYDLGCGDGRIVIAAVRRRGVRGVCNDIDPAMIAKSRRDAEAAGVATRIRFDQGDLFALDLGPATVVALYLSPAINLRLRPKLFRELRPGARVVSHNFGMGDWPADSVERVVHPSGTSSAVRLWLMPADVAGGWDARVTVGGAMRLYRVRFDQRYQQLSGTASLLGRVVPLSAASLRGNGLAFTLTDTLRGRRSPLRLRGRIADGRVAGVVTVGPDSLAGRWQAERR